MAIAPIQNSGETKVSGPFRQLFWTAVARNHECLFGEVMDGDMRLNDAGQAAQAEWVRLPERFQSIELDKFVIMPNHLHGIILVGAGLAPPGRGAHVGAGLAPPGRGAASSAPTLGDILRAFKSISAIAVNRLLGRSGCSLWQRNYYEHIVRNENELARIREYIVNNPAQWALDRENPNYGA
ncbi:MAG: transposase [Gammaproteobacteria bacterium]|nr:transposase [Gammaproteobacteria bacterium]